MSKLFLALSVALATCFSACGKSNTSEAVSADGKQKKAVVVYFSATGSTRAVAEKIASLTGAPIAEIEPVQPYSDADLDWNNKHSRSSLEMTDASARPEVKKASVDLADCDVVILGYPIWWDQAPRVVNSFIENNNLKGKTVIPFATSGGSGIENSVSQLRKTYPELNFTDGCLLNRVSDKTIKDSITPLL